MRTRTRLLLATLAASTLTACGGDDPVSPGDHARDVAARFDHLADSLERAGVPDGATAAAALAEAIRTSGRVGSLVLGVDGRTERFEAIALHLDAPPCQIDCEAPTSLQLLFAWQGTNVDEGFAVLTDAIGQRSAVLPELVCDASNACYTPNPEAIGMLAERTGADAARVWGTMGGWVTIGTPAIGASCPQSGLIPVGASYLCRLATFAYAAQLDLANLEDETVTASRRVTMTGQSIPGLSIELTTPPTASTTRALQGVFAAQPAFLVGARQAR